MEMKFSKRICSFLLMLAVCVAMFGVSITPVHAASGVTIKSGKSMTLTVGQTKAIKVKAVKGKKVTYKSSNKSIATVSKKGKVAAKKAGKCVITVKQGKKTGKVKVTVKAKAAPAQPVYKTAYELAVEKGYKGTLERWINVLTGKTIEEGKTAFDLVVADGYTGDMQDWLATLVTAKDKDGQNAFDVAAENGYKGSFAEWMAFLVNDNKQDEQKPDEFVIEKSYVDENNNLIIVLADGTEINIGNMNDLVDPAVKTFTVTFNDYDGNTLKVENVIAGSSATAPVPPERNDGFVFIGWDKEFDRVTEDLVVTALYKDETAPVISVGNVTAKAGDQSVEVPVTVKNNPGILGMTLTLTYDEGAMTLTGASNGDALSVLTMTKPKEFKSGCNFLWDGIELNQDDIKDGTILTLTFDISDGAIAGVYPVKASYADGDITNADLIPIDMEMAEGSITIEQ